MKNKEFNVKKKKIDYAKVFFIIAFIVILMIYILIVEIFFGFRREETYFSVEEREKIYSLKSNQGFQGGFFVLGYGAIRHTNYYVYFLKDEEFGGFVKEQIPTDKTLLIEKDTIPSVVRRYLQKKTEIKRFFWEDEVKYKDIPYNDFSNPIPKEMGYQYILTVPIGTITENQKYEPL